MSPIPHIVKTPVLESKEYVAFGPQDPESSLTAALDTPLSTYDTQAETDMTADSARNTYFQFIMQPRMGEEENGWEKIIRNGMMKESIRPLSAETGS